MTKKINQGRKGYQGELALILLRQTGLIELLMLSMSNISKNSNIAIKIYPQKDDEETEEFSLEENISHKQIQTPHKFFTG